MAETKDQKKEAGSTRKKSPQIGKARLGKVVGRSDKVRDWVDVHFNPASVQLQSSNELKDHPKLKRKQYVASTSVKLSMELIFDTTHTGDDVTGDTRKIQAFITPPIPKKEKSRKRVRPPVVLFEWGALRFKGIIESYSETIDYFSAEGVPLRSSINITLSKQDQVFDPSNASGEKDKEKDRKADAIDFPNTTPDKLAKRLGNQRHGRDIAAANGKESVRNGNDNRSGNRNGNGLTVNNPQESVRPPSAFSQTPNTISFIDNAETSLPDVGSAGIASQAKLTASEGAFSGLKPSLPTSSSRIDLDGIAELSGSIQQGIQASGNIQVGGQARAGGSLGVRADVGLSAKLRFDED